MEWNHQKPNRIKPNRIIHQAKQIESQPNWITTESNHDVAWLNRIEPNPNRNRIRIQTRISIPDNRNRIPDIRNYVHTPNRTRIQNEPKRNWNWTQNASKPKWNRIQTEPTSNPNWIALLAAKYAPRKNFKKTHIWKLGFKICANAHLGSQMVQKDGVWIIFCTKTK